MTTTPVSSAVNRGCSVGNVPGGRRNRLLASQRSRDRQHRNDEDETTDEHAEAEVEVEPRRGLPLRPAKAEPLLLAGDVYA